MEASIARPFSKCLQERPTSIKDEDFLPGKFRLGET